MTKKNQNTKPLTFRFRVSEGERKLISEAAKSVDLTDSAFARQAVLKEARKRKEKRDG